MRNIVRDRSAVQTLLQNTVMEARFVRRHPKTGWSMVRGAFITTNWTVLNSDLGVNILNFRPPSGAGMSYDHTTKNLVVAWDIFRQDYRCFGVEKATILNYYDVTTPKDRIDFWVYFAQRFYAMGQQERLTYMGLE